jgi:hypothetical protein
MSADAEACGAAAQDNMHRGDIRLAEQCLLVNKSGAGGPGLSGQVLAPGDHLHAEGETAVLSKLSASGSVTRPPGMGSPGARPVGRVSNQARGDG